MPMTRKLFFIHFILFLLLGLFLYLSDVLTIRSTFVHLFYAVVIFCVFFSLWSISILLKSKALHYLIVFLYYNYLFLVYVLFALGKENLGVPMTLKMIYPYFENFSMLSNLISYSKLILLLIGYVLIFGLVFYYWNISYKTIGDRKLPKVKLNSRAKGLGLLSTMLICYFLFSSNYLIEKFKGHQINEPYLTLIYFDEAFNRQKEKGEENLLAFEKYESPVGNKKNVILIICDALRPDFFQSEERLTPFIDSLLSTPEFIAHKNMYSTSAFSFNGISNILSSSRELYQNNFFIHDVLKKKGYDINFMLSGDMTNFWNLKGHIKTESVDSYSDGYENFKYGRSRNLNDDKTNILDRLNKLKPYDDVPSFFYFHMMSVHQVGHLDEKKERFKTGGIDLSSTDFDQQLLINDYKNRMIQLDEYIRILFSILKRKNYLDDYVLVITSDHGQSLGENGIYFHSKYLNYESIKIPFIINYSKAVDTNAITSQLDIAPTILDALDLKVPNTWKGKAISDSIPKTIYQTQGDYYSMIWKQQAKTYQLHFDKKSNIYNLFNISPESKNKHKDIIAQWNQKDLDSLKKLLISNFNLN